MHEPCDLGLRVRVTSPPRGTQLVNVFIHESSAHYDDSWVLRQDCWIPLDLFPNQILALVEMQTRPKQSHRSRSNCPNYKTQEGSRIPRQKFNDKIQQHRMDCEHELSLYCVLFIRTSCRARWLATVLRLSANEMPDIHQNCLVHSTDCTRKFLSQSCTEHMTWSLTYNSV